MIEIDNFTKSDFQPYNDDYVYIPIKPKVHQQHSRKIMDKMIQKYFNKVEETALNPTRVFGNKWQSLKATYDTYMGLTPNERRRVDVSNMRGYQFDKNSKKLYSFEDNCVYNVTVADKFNKIVVVSKDHLLSDTEKRAVFDNPFQFEPISPYRITWPTSTIRDMKDLSIIEINKSVDKLSDTMNAFTTNMNTVMDNISSTTSALVNQNAMIYNDFKQQRQQQEQQEQKILNSNRLYYNRDGSYVIDRSKALYVHRGSKNYNTLIEHGWKENGDGTMVHIRFIEEPQPVVQNVIQQQMDIQPLIMQVNNVVATLSTFVDQMTSLDLATNIADIHSILGDIATVVRGIPKNQLVMNNAMIKSITDLQKQITTIIDKQVPALTDLNNAFNSLSSSIMNRENRFDEQIGRLINAQNDLFKKSEDIIAALQQRIDPGREVAIANVVPGVDPEVLKGINSMESFFKFFKSQFLTYLTKMLDANNALIEKVIQNQNNQSEALTTISRTNYQHLVEQLQKVNTSIEQSYNHFNPLLEDLSQQSTNTQEMLTNLQRDNHLLMDMQIDNQNMHKDNQNMMLDMYDDNRNMLGVINQNVVNGNQQRDAQMQMINSLQDQQSYLNWMMENGLTRIENRADQFYQDYLELQRKIPQIQFTNNNIPLLDGTSVSQLLLTNDNSTIAPAIVDKVNTIVPVIVEYDKFNNANMGYINERDVIRDDFLSFLNVLAKNRDNIVLMQKCRSTGPRFLFSIFRLRHNFPKISEFFVRLANGVITTEEEMDSYFDYFENNILNHYKEKADINQMIDSVINSVLYSNNKVQSRLQPISQGSEQTQPQDSTQSIVQSSMISRQRRPFIGTRLLAQKPEQTDYRIIHTNKQ